MWVVIGLAVLAGAAALAAGPIMSRVKEPAYSLVSTEGNIELRDYAPMVIAEVDVEGQRGEAANAGFLLLADYIFGNNAPAEKLQMTAPVIQAPDNGRWKVRFVMPAEYTVETLPAPNNTQVSLIPLAAKRFAVIRFSGTSSSGNLDRHRERLMAYAQDKKLGSKGPPIMAFYNPPWTFPLFRRNEIMIEVEQPGPTP